ncbi:hypothetical protein K8R47_00120 [archaeon]|nr:hypothetical protein [archaeon]
MERLEKKLKKPDWKQWVPVYGIYQIFKDKVNNKPSLADDFADKELRLFCSVLYQSTSVVAFTGGIYKFIEKLF